MVQSCFCVHSTIISNNLTFGINGTLVDVNQNSESDDYVNYQCTKE